MVFSKKDIERARERNALNIGREKFGEKVKSIDNLDFSPNTKFIPLGERLKNNVKKYNKRFSR